MHNRYFYTASFFGKDGEGVPQQIGRKPGGGIKNKGMFFCTGG